MSKRNHINRLERLNIQKMDLPDAVQAVRSALETTLVETARLNINFLQACDEICSGLRLLQNLNPGLISLPAEMDLVEEFTSRYTEVRAQVIQQIKDETKAAKAHRREFIARIGDGPVLPSKVRGPDRLERDRRIENALLTDAKAATSLLQDDFRAATLPHLPTPANLSFTDLFIGVSKLLARDIGKKAGAIRGDEIARTVELSMQPRTYMFSMLAR